MEEQLNRIEQKLTGLNAQYKDLHDALVGDEYGNTGIIRRLNEVEKKAVDAHSFTTKTRKTLRYIWGAIVAFFGWLVSKVFE